MKNSFMKLEAYDKYNNPNIDISIIYQYQDKKNFILISNNSEKFENTYINFKNNNIFSFNLSDKNIVLFFNMISKEYYIKNSMDLLENGFEILLHPNEIICYQVFIINNVSEEIINIFNIFSNEFSISNNIEMLKKDNIKNLLKHLISTYRKDFRISSTNNALESFFINYENENYLFIENTAKQESFGSLFSSYFSLNENNFIFLEDLITNKIYIRKLNEVLQNGLFISLHKEGVHLFKIKNIKDNKIHIVSTMFEQLNYSGFNKKDIFNEIMFDKSDFVDIEKYIPSKNIAYNEDQKWIKNNIQELKDKILVYLCMEMFIPELYEQMNNGEYNGAVDANFSGGLGILAGCTMEGFKNIGLESYAIIPMYKMRRVQTIDSNLNQIIKEEKIDYTKNKNLKQTIDEETGLNLEIVTFIENQKYTVNIWEINRAGTKVYLIEENEVFDILYTGDREKRLKQEVLIGKIVPLLLKNLNIKPNIIHLNEAHTVIAAINIKEWKNITNQDDFFEKTRIAFTIHTPRKAGMEVFYCNFSKLEIPYNYKQIFDKKNSGSLDFTNAAIEISDIVNTVSNNQIKIVKNRIFQDIKYHNKIIGIMNGSSKSYWTNDEIRNILDKEEICFDDLSKIFENNKIKTNQYIKSILLKENYYKILQLDNFEFNLDVNKPSAWAVRRIVDYKNQWPLLKDIIKIICASKDNLIETEFGTFKGLGFQVVIGGMAHPNDKISSLWIHEFLNWSKGYWRNDLSKEFIYSPELIGNFIFLPSFNEGLGRILKISATTSDVCLEIPMWDEEACGTSGMRALGNANICIDSSDGALEWAEDGYNTFILNPYNKGTLLKHMEKISNIYYAFINKYINHLSLDNDEFLTMKKNALLTWQKKLNVDIMAKRYSNEIYYPIIKSQILIQK